MTPTKKDDQICIEESCLVVCVGNKMFNCYSGISKLQDKHEGKSKLSGKLPNESAKTWIATSEHMRRKFQKCIK